MKIIHLAKFPILLILALNMSCVRQNGVYDISRFGASGDGKKINTSYINKAIERCSKDGGGMVLVPPGRFITGTIVLRKGVDLHLEHGAVLIGSKDTSDYLRMENVLFSEGYSRYGLVVARNTSDFSISGYGEINGNGTYFMNGIDKPHLGHDYDRKFTRQGDDFMRPDALYEDGPLSYSFRPGMLITIEQCEKIRISGVTMKDSPEWTIKLENCDDVDIEGITIENNKLVPNSDGIHCTTSRNIRISGCNIFAGDDAIIVTGFGHSPVPSDPEMVNYKPEFGNKTGRSENVTVTNCILSSRSACIRVGYGTHPVRNVVFSNIVMYESNRGIGIFARNDGDIENIQFSNIIINTRIYSGHWWGKGEPVHISAISETENGKPGRISHIRLSDIMAFSETGVVIYGTPGSIVSDVAISDMSLNISKGKHAFDYGGNFDLRPAWPMDKAVFKHDIPGIYAGYTDGLKISGLTLSWGDSLPDFYTSGIQVENFSNLMLEDMNVGKAHASPAFPDILLVNGRSVIVRDCYSGNRQAEISKSNVN